MFALNKGRAALSLGKSREASLWLDRACRLAPRDVAVKLLYTSSLIGIDDFQAFTQLEAIAASHPGAWTAMRLLATQAHRLGKMGRATELVSSILSRSDIPADTAFRDFAARLAVGAGLPGWAGLSYDGVVSFSAPSDLKLDSVPVRVQPAFDGELFRVRLPKTWRSAGTLDVMRFGRHLLGSPIDVASRNIVQGFVDLGSAGRSRGALLVRGWAWIPACPDVQPDLRLLSSAKRVVRSFVADDESHRPTHGDSAARPRGFTVDLAGLPDLDQLRVVDHLGHDLHGSPLNLAVHRALWQPIVPKAPRQTAGVTCPAVSPLPARPDLDRGEGGPKPACATRANRPPFVDIVIAVFSRAAELRTCVASLRRSQAADYRLVIVYDASQDGALQAVLGEVAAEGAIILRQKHTKGLPGAVNAGLRHALASDGEARDVVLLNPNTLMPPGWLDSLRSTAYAGDDIGSVTPMTDDGSVASYPAPGRVNRLGTQGETDTMARFFSAASSDVIEMPAALGFCTYIKQACLVSTGLLREDLFAQGGGEDVDWSMRASQAGWRHVLHSAAFVSHAGDRLSGAAEQELLRRNMAVLNRLHPGYNGRIKGFLDSAPLRAVRRKVDVVRWREATERSGSVILITHTLGGGVERHVRARALEIRRQGLRPIILRPVQQPERSHAYEAACHVAEEDAEAFPNLLFPWHAAHAELLAILRPEKPRWIEIHHLFGHDPQALTLPGLLGVPYDVLLHDFAAVCPRITLCGDTKRYCGQPADVRACEACVRNNGNRLPDARDPALLREQTAILVAGARRVVAPTADTARRFARYASAARMVVQPWENDVELSAAVRGPKRRFASANVRVCVVGAIGTEKGYGVLLACARDAARRGLALSFTVVGHTINDKALIDTEKVFVTGYYVESECLDLIRRSQADVGLLPSVWPETWCYALSALWRADLWPVVFDLGAQAERVRRTGKGTLLPLSLSARRINAALLALGSDSAPAVPLCRLRAKPRPPQ